MVSREGHTVGPTRVQAFLPSVWRTRKACKVAEEIAFITYSSCETGPQACGSGSRRNAKARGVNFCVKHSSVKTLNLKGPFCVQLFFYHIVDHSSTSQQLKHKWMWQMSGKRKTIFLPAVPAQQIYIADWMNHLRVLLKIFPGINKFPKDSMWPCKKENFNWALQKKSRRFCWPQILSMTIPRKATLFPVTEDMSGFKVCTSCITAMCMCPMRIGCLDYMVFRAMINSQMA